MVEAVDLLTGRVIFEKAGTSLVFGSYSEPVVGVGLLDTKVGRNSVARIIVVVNVLDEVDGLLVLEAEGFLHGICETGSHICNDFMVDKHSVWEELQRFMYGSLGRQQPRRDALHESQ